MKVTCRLRRGGRRFLLVLVGVLASPSAHLDEMIWWSLDKLMDNIEEKGSWFLLISITAIVVGMYGVVRLVYWLLNVFFEWWGLWMTLLCLIPCVAGLWRLRLLLLWVLRWVIKRIDPDPLLEAARD